MESEKVLELSKDICNACKTRHKCDNQICTMSEIVAKELINKNWQKLNETELKKRSQNLAIKSILNLSKQHKEDIKKAEEVRAKEILKGLLSMANNGVYKSKLSSTDIKLFFKEHYNMEIKE